MINLAVNGAAGRMGSRICALARDDARFNLVAPITRSDTADTAPAAHRACDLVIDFSTDDGAQRAVDIARAAGAALLVGTTALSQQTRQKIGDLAHSAPVMIAPNTSRGIAVLNDLIARAARLLGDQFDIDIVDVHHRHKRDAPSGTALALVDSLRRADVALPEQRVHSIRSGDVIGDHDVLFAGPGERIKISHSATSRDVFALGALQAGAWLHGREPGQYTMADSLGLTP